MRKLWSPDFKLCLGTKTPRSLTDLPQQAHHTLALSVFALISRPFAGNSYSDRPSASSAARTSAISASSISFFVTTRSRLLSVVATPTTICTPASG